MHIYHECDPISDLPVVIPAANIITLINSGASGAVFFYGYVMISHHSGSPVPNFSLQDSEAQYFARGEGRQGRALWRR